MLRTIFKENFIVDHHDDENVTVEDFSGNEIERVIKVVASDKWLSRIKKHITGIPGINLGITDCAVAWYGVHAQFIAGNITDLSDAHWQYWMESDQ